MNTTLLRRAQIQLKETPERRDLLFSLLSYSQDEGQFVWLSGKRRSRVAGYADDRGYVRIGVWVDGKRQNYLAHRLAILFSYGSWPLNHVDHIDGDPSNNKLSNLREATHAQNMQNVKDFRLGSRRSKFRGVSWHARDKLWYARIKVSGKIITLGYFKQEQDAATAYLHGKRVHHQFGERA